LTEETRYVAVDQKLADAHWKENASLVGFLLAVWFVVTWIASIFAASLNKITILGFPLGYVTGSMLALFVYTAMIFYYAHRMDQIDEKYGMKE
jgi:putative solute:sodium symporter small subunit